MKKIYLIIICIVYGFGIIPVESKGEKTKYSSGMTKTITSKNKTGEHISETVITDNNDGYVMFKMNNKIISVAPLKNGKLHGTQIIFFETGEIDRFIDFNLGQPTGNETSFYKNKNIKRISRISESGDVVVKKYDENGNILE
ncbi:hypothetical protein QPK87_30220 [Kamptonema cortianum]|nr:hypothetical protein [Kamptonema cortianum]